MVLISWKDLIPFFTTFGVIVLGTILIMLANASILDCKLIPAFMMLGTTVIIAISIILAFTIRQNE